MKTKNIIIGSITLLILIAVSSMYIAGTSSKNGLVIKTVEIKKGSVSNTVTATGTLEATNTVIVGTQVSGVIEKLYVDFNSKVKKGQLIAELDKSTLQSNLENTEAELANAEAELEYQKNNLERNKALFDKNMLSESDLDLSRYNYKKSEATVKSAQANLKKAGRSLSYATIYAPIDGIVLNREVEEGQTVTASMNTPELFTIANDLTEMQVEADVDEADIGMVKEGQRVEFTVDAFPDEVFTGEVSQVRLQPQESSNVVTYTVIVTVANPDLKLKPGMTASITDYVEEVNDVLVIAGKAIRFKPEREQMREYFESLPESERSKPLGPSSSRGSNDMRVTKIDNESSDNIKTVWLKKGTQIKPVQIETGLNDGLNLEILSGLESGDLVVVSMEKGETEIEEDSKNTEKSPFVPERTRGKK